MKELEAVRKKINELDQEIVRLLQKRFDMVSDVAAIKKQIGMPILDQNREASIMKSLDGLKYEHELKEVYKSILMVSKNLQRDE